MALKVDKYNTNILVAENAERAETLLEEISEKTKLYEILETQMMLGETILLQIEKLGDKHYKIFMEVKDSTNSETVN